MAKYVFLNFPTFGQINPTLAVVHELITRGDEVVYFTTEAWRTPLEQTGARVQIYDAPLFRHQTPHHADAEVDNQYLARLPLRMLQTSRQVVPRLVERVRAEQPTCLVYSGLLLWARIVAATLGVPGVALWPTYAPTPHFGAGLRERLSAVPECWEGLEAEFRFLRATYQLPFTDVAAFVRGAESLTLVFLPRTFQPDGETFDQRFRFVGPSFHPQRDAGHPFPLERLGPRPRLYISLGTLYNQQRDFYHLCFRAFGMSKWHVILSFGTQLDPLTLPPIPANFFAAPQVPQLDVLPHVDLFLSHGGMNSTMESLSFGVPLLVLPHTREQQQTARRVEALGLGVALDEKGVTEDVLREAVAQITQQTQYQERVQGMRQQITEAGGYLRATDALQDFVRSQRMRHDGASLTTDL